MSWSYSKTDVASEVLSDIHAYQYSPLSPLNVPPPNQMPPKEKAVAIAFCEMARAALRNYPDTQIVSVSASGFMTANNINTANVSIVSQ